MSELTKEDLSVLKAHFKPNEHEFLNGRTYITEQAVCNRIEEVDPAWDFTLLNVISRDQQITVSARLTVKGVSRDGVGMESVKVSKEGRETNEAEKSAATDALKRCARLFGVGRYLLDLPSNVTDVNSLAHWLENGGKVMKTEEVRVTLGSGNNGRRIPPPEVKVTWDTPDILVKFLDKCRRELEVPNMTASEVARLAQVGTFEDLTDWRIYDNPYTAFDAVKIAFERGLEEKPAPVKAKKSA